ncbi:MAG: hypothetical protein ACI86X_002258 [Moritella sp.]
MKFFVECYAGESGATPGQFDHVLSLQSPQVLYSDLPEYEKFLSAAQVAFTQPTLAEDLATRWQALITAALANSDLVQKSQDAPLLMVLPHVDTPIESKRDQLQRQLLDAVIPILPAWTTHPNTDYYQLGSAGFFQALRQADKLLSSGQSQVVIGAIDSWATEQGIVKFVSQFSDYASVVLPASEGAIFVVLSRQAKGIEVLGCGMDAVLDRQAPNGLIALVGDMKAALPAPVTYLSLCYSGDSNLDQVGHFTLSALPGLYDANTQFITPQINQGDIGACYSLLHFLTIYHHYEQRIWQGTSLQIYTSSLPFVGAAVYRWFD